MAQGKSRGTEENLQARLGIEPATSRLVITYTVLTNWSVRTPVETTKMLLKICKSRIVSEERCVMHGQLRRDQGVIKLGFLRLPGRD